MQGLADRTRSLLTGLTTLTATTALISLAQPAHAANESMQLSSYSSSTQVSGSASTTASAPTSLPSGLAIEVRFPIANYSSFRTIDPTLIGNCTSFLTLAVNSVNVTPTYCIGEFVSAGSNSYYRWYVRSTNRTSVTTGDVIALSWDSTGLQTGSSGSYTASVWDVSGQVFVDVLTNSSTPTSTATPEAAPPWLQAYAVSSASADCRTGWARSWQPWAEAVSGGWVCTRTIPSLGPDSQAQG